MKTLIKSEGNLIPQNYENEKGNFKVNYQYGSHTGNVWTDWYENSFNSLHEAIDDANNIIEEFNKDNENCSRRSRIDLFIEKE